MKHGQSQKHRIMQLLSSIRDQSKLIETSTHSYFSNRSNQRKEKRSHPTFDHQIIRYLKPGKEKENLRRSQKNDQSNIYIKQRRKILITQSQNQSQHKLSISPITSSIQKSPNPIAKLEDSDHQIRRTSSNQVLQLKYKDH